MKKIKVDVAVVGAGTAGLYARRAAEKAGARVLLIGKPPHGTTCARVGCMPSKLLIAAAEAAHAVKQASLFGLKTSLEVDGPRVLRRVQEKRDGFVSFVRGDIGNLLKRRKMIEGEARLESPHLLRVNQTGVEAKAIVFATGVSAVIPEDYRGFEDLILTNETVFEMKRLPKSVLVVGTGLIGLEMGQALHRLGTRVTLVGHKNKIGPLSDPEVLEAAHRIFGGELDLHPDHQFGKIKRNGRGARVQFHGRRGRLEERQVEKILIAAGRRPHLDRGSLERFGVRFGERGFPIVDEKTERAGRTHFFFAGDAAGVRPLLHEAAHEGRIAGQNAASCPRVKRFKRYVPLAIVFTDPGMAIVGRPWRELDADRIEAGEIDYEKQGRAQIMGVNRGRVRLYAERRSGRFVGAEMLGPRVEHTAHLLAWALENQMTVQEMLARPFYHPVIEEGIQSALEDLRRKTQKE